MCKCVAIVHNYVYSVFVLCVCKCVVCVCVCAWVTANVYIISTYSPVIPNIPHHTDLLHIFNRYFNISCNSINAKKN